MNILNPFFALIHLVINIAVIIIIAQVILSWLIAFGILNLNTDFVRSIWGGLNRITEPFYSKIRGFLPQIGGLDLAPLVALLIIQFISWFIPTGGRAFY